MKKKNGRTAGQDKTDVVKNRQPESDSDSPNFTIVAGAVSVLDLRK